MKKLIVFIIIQYSIFNIQYSASAQSWQWFSTIGGGGQAINPDIPDEQVAEMVTDSAGNVYVCGRFIGQGSPTINGTPIPSFGGYDIFVAKFNCAGNLVWVKTAGNFDYGDDAMSLVLDNFGHLYVTGEVYSSPFSSYCNFMGDTIYDDVNDMFLCKMDTSGNLLWVKWAAPNTGSFNTASLPYQMQLKSNGNLKIFFSLSAPGLFWSGDSINTRGIYIAEFDTAGTFLDADTVLSSNFGLGNFVDFVLDNNQNQYITGYFYSDSIEIGGQIFYKQSLPSFSSGDMIIAKFNSTGSLQWIQQIAINDSILNIPFGIIIKDNYLYVASNGRQGIVGNDTLINTLSNNNFPYVIKLNTNGQIIWAKGSSSQYPFSCTGGIGASSNNASLYISGNFSGIANFNTISINSPLGSGLYVAEIDTAGNWQSAQSLEGLSSDTYPLCTTIDAIDNILVAGGFDGPLIFNGNQITSAGGYTDGFIAKYGLQCSVGIQEQTTNTQGQLFLYPNPATNYINVQTSGFNNSTITILNTMGQTIFTQNVLANQDHVSLNISNLSSGIYFVKVNDVKNSTTQKFIKQ